MKRTIAFLLGSLALAGSALAQAPASADPYAYIVAAAPANQRADATVIKWKPDFTYDTLKKGTNKFHSQGRCIHAASRQDRETAWWRADRACPTKGVRGPLSCTLSAHLVKNGKNPHGSTKARDKVG